MFLFKIPFRRAKKTREEQVKKEQLKEQLKEEQVWREEIIARLKKKSATNPPTEFDDDVERWNPADEARQAKRLESWLSQSQESGHKANDVLESPDSEAFRPYQNPRHNVQQATTRTPI